MHACVNDMCMHTSFVSMVVGSIHTHTHIPHTHTHTHTHTQRVGQGMGLPPRICARRRRAAWSMASSSSKDRSTPSEAWPGCTGCTGKLFFLVVDCVNRLAAPLRRRLRQLCYVPGQKHTHTPKRGMVIVVIDQPRPAARPGCPTPAGAPTGGRTGQRAA